VLATTLASPSSEPPLTAAHYRELELAQARARPVRKAARVAGFNGWTTAVLAVLSAPFAPFSLVGFLMTVGLSVVAYNELRGRKRLLAFDPSAASLLGWNQLGLLAMVAGYCLWMLWASRANAEAVTAELQASPELSDALGSLGDIDALYRQITLAFYGTVAAVSVAVQGLTALYSFSRRTQIEAYLRDTPAWAMDLGCVASHA
jgi:hypothetical protein